MVKRLEADELNMILGTLREFAERKLPLEKRLEWDEKDHCPVEEVREMMGPEVGLHLVFIPEEYGGMGGSCYDIYRLCEEFAKVDLGVATAMLAVSLGMDPIRVGGNDEQKKKWLGKIADEQLLVAYGVTEPEAGSNVEALKTKADPCNGGYRITGVKQFISNGAIADLFTILAKAPGGPSFFVVEKGAKGLGAGKREDKHGIRLSNTAQVILEDVEVPAENLLGKEGEGIKQANEVFGYTRLMVAAFGLGAGEAVMEKAIAYSKERKQFGTFLHEKAGYMNKLIVPWWVRIEAARAYIEEVAERLDNDEKDLHVEGSIAKLFATEIGNAAAEAAIQALGGYGYCREYGIEKMKRDARILTIYEGTSEIQQNIIGLFRMRTNVRSKGAYYENLAKEMDELEKSGANVGAGAVATAARTLGQATLFSFKNKLSRNQHALFEFADCATDIECAVALCRRAAKGDDFLKACSRIWAAESSSLATHRLQRLYRGAAEASDEEVSALTKIVHDGGLLGRHKGRLADMEAVGKALISR